jgi:uncharacterized protein YegJ (DUF2314 family)
MHQSTIRHTLAAVALAALSACGGAPKEEALSPAVAKEKAAEEARTHLPFFLERLALRDPSDRAFQVTIRLPAEGRSLPRAELVIRDVVRQGSSFHGVIAVADKNWPDFELGETMSFPASIVSDWAFTHNSTIIGLFQLRAQLCSLPGRDKEAAAARKQLIAAATTSGGLSFAPEDACKPADPRKDHKNARAPK